MKDADDDRYSSPAASPNDTTFGMRRKMKKNLEDLIKVHKKKEAERRARMDSNYPGEEVPFGQVDDEESRKDSEYGADPLYPGEHRKLKKAMRDAQKVVAKITL